MNAESDAMTTAVAEWEAALQALISDHFSAARARVEPFYQQHFSRLSVILSRHWQHRRDIPRDLATLPRAAWRMASQLRRKSPPPSPELSLKEQAIAQLVVGELLQLPPLQQRLLAHLEQHPQVSAQQWQALHGLLDQYSPEQAQVRLRQALERLAVTREGGRDMAIFLSLGMLGRGLGDKLAFGSAMGLGSAAATSVYIGQQSFLAGLWAQWFGAPGWVVAGGAVGGAAVVLLCTPLIAPLAEFGVNKVRAKRFLHEAVDRVERDISDTRADAGSLAGQMGSYVQLLPDLLQLLRTLR